MERCKICNETKDSAKPRFIGNKNIKDPRFNNSILVARNLVMCGECYMDFREGRIKLDEQVGD